jgi:hypothetical protein
MYSTLRFDADPTSWELWEELECVPAFDAPEVLEVNHPLKGYLVLSHRSVASAVFLSYELSLRVDGTRPDGCPIPEPGGALYLPSPTGPDLLSEPPNLYPLAGTVDLATLQERIIAAMREGTVLRVEVAQGEVVINGAKVPFAILCPQNPPPPPASDGAST